MTRTTCDRCGAKIDRQPWMQTKFPMLTIMNIPGQNQDPYSIDLCDKCTREFIIWLDEGPCEAETKTEKGEEQ